jgi:hypothetical protein
MYLLLSIAVLMAPMIGAAQTLKETKAINGWKEDLDKADAKVKAACGKNITAKMDQASWLKAMPAFVAENASMVDGCEQVMETIASMCEDADSKGAIVKKIDNVACVAGGDKGFVKFEFAGKTLKFTSGIFPYARDPVKKFLENNL